MKKLSCIISLLWALMNASQLMSQHFQAADSLSFPTLSNARVFWADLDKNSYQDALIFGIDSLGKSEVFILKNDSLKSSSPFQLSTEVLFPEIPALANIHISFADFNQDTFQDLLITGIDSTQNFVVQIWENKKDFNFEIYNSNISNWEFAAGEWVDLDKNGTYDLVITGARKNNQKEVVCYKNENGNFVEITTSIPGLSEAGITLLEADGNTLTDLIISGKDELDQWKTIQINNNGAFEFAYTIIEENFGGNRLSTGDLNHDGMPEFAISGKYNGENSQTRFYLNSNGTFSQPTFLNNGQATELLIADLNKDGFVDIFYSGEDENANSQLLIYQYDSAGSDLSTIQYLVIDTLLPNIKNASLSDADNDGDLDFLLIDDATGISGIYQNQFPGENNMPFAPVDPFAIGIHGRTMFSWIPTTDDHTPVEALTYDIFIIKEKSSEDSLLVSPNFGNGGARHLPAHGITGHNPNYTLNKLVEGQLDWGIQAIDNSLANKPSNNICNGNGFYNCIDITLKDTVACYGNTLTLADPVEGQTAIWFSLKDGYLGEFDTLHFDPVENDTIFYVVKNDFSCALGVSWSIEVAPELELKLGNDTTLCQTGELSFSIDSDGWEKVEWISANQGNLGSDSNITLTFLESDMIKLIATDSSGCIYSDSVNINIPEIKAYASEDVTIQEGESTQLEAFNALTAQWSPDYYIDDSQSISPTVSPLITTNYFVQMQDSSGCKVIDTVVVTVERAILTGTVFIPNLFTPNSDGSNDNFKIYGLQNVNTVSFHIFDSSGNKVYQSDDPNSLQATGWDGTKSGRMLKNGTYFWRIAGEYQNGEPILVGGKNEGYLTLLK